ncbi:MAG: class I SAM-dependent methyltransferase [Patescibacteria group bacterium]|nr:class I SAM-dependent methyltransferase [Patescibacteria group bacterium]
MTAGLNTGNAKAALQERGDDLYETPSVATEALLRVEKLPEIIWEPACGPGSIVRTLRKAGHKVYATDLVDYGCPDSEARVDFLMEQGAPTYIGAIVTNPPFKLAAEFVTHALTIAPKVVMLLRLAFIESERRRAILDCGRLARVHVFRNRLPMMHRAGRGTMVAKTNSSAMAFAWFVWDHEHRGPTEMHRISWLPEMKSVND